MAKPKLLSELSNKVPVERTINDKALSSDIDITMSDLEGILPVEKGGTGVTSLSALATTMGATKIQAGSYTGTGKVGRSNPNNITVGFKPKFLFIASIGLNISEGESQPFIWGEGITKYMNFGKEMIFTTTATGISWYLNTTTSNSNYIGAQLNASGQTYYYVALG